MADKRRKILTWQYRDNKLLYYYSPPLPPLPSTPPDSPALCPRFRPPCPIIAVTRFPQVARQCHLHRGIFPLLHTAERVTDWLQDVELRVQYAVNFGRDSKIVRPGDPLVIVTGWKAGAGFTNTMRVIYA